MCDMRRRRSRNNETICICTCRKDSKELYSYPLEEFAFNDPPCLLLLSCVVGIAQPVCETDAQQNTCNPATNRHKVSMKFDKFSKVRTKY